MASVSSPTRTRKSAARHIRLVVPLTADAGSVGIIAITEGKKVDEYVVYRTPSEFPYTKGFSVTKVGETMGESYAALIDQAAPELSSCECKGFLRWGTRKPCRHIAGLTALMKCGKIS